MVAWSGEERAGSVCDWWSRGEFTPLLLFLVSRQRQLRRAAAVGVVAATTTLPRGCVAQIRALIAEFDVSGDGLISRAEFTEMVASRDDIRMAARLAALRNVRDSIET